MIIYNLVSKVKADGCHMGQSDGSIKIAKNKLKNKILGVTCHNSITLAKKQLNKANYLAFGSSLNQGLNHKQKSKFQNIQTSKNKYKATNCSYWWN